MSVDNLAKLAIMSFQALLMIIDWYYIHYCIYLFLKLAAMSQLVIYVGLVSGCCPANCTLKSSSCMSRLHVRLTD